LPGRQNIVITRQTGYAAEGCDVVASVDEALEAAGAAPEVMVIGGGDIYRQLLPRAGRVYLTRVKAEVDGDTFFPELDEADWELVASEAHEANEKNAYAYTFMTFERRAA
jgi:dihydrofolate reductase